jgi:hypothetical protein
MMADEYKVGSEEQPEQPKSDLVKELQILGQELSAAVKSLWESDESRRLREDIGAGFVELGHQLDSAVKAAQEGEATRQFQGQLKETVEKARESELVDKIEEGLISGLRELNVQISKLVDSLAGQPSPTQETAPEPEEPTPAEEEQ